VPDLNAVMMVRVCRAKPGARETQHDMSQWIERILSRFTADLPGCGWPAIRTACLLDEKLLSELRSRGFEVMLYEDPFVFRAEFEERYRAAWDRGEPGQSPALVVHLRGADANDLPWDIVHNAPCRSPESWRAVPQAGLQRGASRWSRSTACGAVRRPRDRVAVGARRKRVQGFHPRTRLSTDAAIHPHAGGFLA
jgi:hypothetical protein